MIVNFSIELKSINELTMGNYFKLAIDIKVICLLNGNNGIVMRTYELPIQWPIKILEYNSYLMYYLLILD